MKLPKYLILTLIIFAIGISGFVFLFSDVFARPSLLSWLQGEECQGFCWQKINAETTPVMLENLLTSDSIQYTTTGFNTHYQWDETQSLSPNGLGQTSAIFSEDGHIIRIIADIRTCVSTILDTYGDPDDIRGEDGHFSIVYFDSEQGEGWSFIFQNDTLPYADVVMRIYNDQNFSIDMNAISQDELLDMLPISCDDEFQT